MDVAVIAVIAPGEPPNVTLLRPGAKFVPVIVTETPPGAGLGLVGPRVPIVGGEKYVKAAVAVTDWAPAEVIVTSTAGPAAPAGVVQVRLVGLVTVTPVAGVPPKVTDVSPTAK